MRKYFTLIFIVLFGISAFGHAIDYVVESESQSFSFYLWEGVRHIIPLGLDHILFILCIFFLSTSLKKVIIQASMFTLAHSITLGLVMFNVIDPPMKWVEVIIALSIVFLAVENLFIDKVKPARIIIIFLFGLIHGMGFANALNGLNMPKEDLINALIGFNLGVEIAQISIILFLTLIIQAFRSRPVVYRKAVVVPTSILIICIAGYWTIERIFS